MAGDGATQGGRMAAFREIREAARLTFRAWKPILAYGVLTQAVAFLVLAPALAWTLFQGLRLVTGGTVLNYAMTSLAGIGGLLLGILWVIVVSLLTVFGFSGTVLVAAAAEREQSVRFLAVLRQVLAAMTRVPGPGAVKLALLTALLIPFVASIVWFFASLVLPSDGNLLSRLLPIGGGARLLFALVLGLAGLGAFTLYVRWSVSIQALALDRQTLGRAMKTSTRLVRPFFWSSARLIFLHHLLLATALALLSLGLDFLTEQILRSLARAGNSTFDVVLALLLVGNSVVLSVAVIFSLAIGVALTTRLYDRLGGATRPDVMAAVSSETPDVAGKVGRRLAPYLLLGVVALVVATLFTLPAVRSEMDKMGHKVQVTAHRGSSAEAPENTLAALRLAIEDGADYAELDIQQAKDGTLVMLHDGNLERTAGVDRNVWDLTGEELTRLDVGKWFDPRFEGERIATFEEVLDATKGKLKLNVELKVHGHEIGDTTAAAMAKFAGDAVRATHAAGVAEDCVITSLDYAVLQAVRKEDPDFRVGAIVTAKIGRVGALDVDFYSTQPLIATVSFIRQAHADGREVHVWTLNDRKDLVAFIERGADNLITDHPRLALAVLAERTPEDDLGATVRRLFQE